jgi:hypothetical protein
MTCSTTCSDSLAHLSLHSAYYWYIESTRLCSTFFVGVWCSGTRSPTPLEDCDVYVF